MVQILNFQRDLVVMRFIRIELIICSTNKVDKVHIHVKYTYMLCFISIHFAVLVLLPRTVCNALVAGGRRSGAGQQAMCQG